MGVRARNRLHGSARAPLVRGRADTSSTDALTKRISQRRDRAQPRSPVRADRALSSHSVVATNRQRCTAAEHQAATGQRHPTGRRVTISRAASAQYSSLTYRPPTCLAESCARPRRNARACGSPTRPPPRTARTTTTISHIIAVSSWPNKPSLSHTCAPQTAACKRRRRRQEPRHPPQRNDTSLTVPHE